MGLKSCKLWMLEGDNSFVSLTGGQVERVKVNNG